MVKLKKKNLGNEIRYLLNDGNGREAVLSLYPLSNRRDFALALREAKAMIRQQVGFFR